MKYYLLLVLSLFVVNGAYGQVGGLNFNSDRAKAKRMSEYKEKSISITSSSGEVSYKSLEELDNQLVEAVNLYTSAQYEDAYPLISELSQWGIKPAQMLLGSMYLHGLQVPQSTELSMAWFGVAKELKSEKQADKMFKLVYKQLDKPDQKLVDSVVKTHIAKFGSKAQNYKCKKRKTTGTNISKKECKKTLKSNSVLHPIQ